MSRSKAREAFDTLDGAIDRLVLAADFAPRAVLPVQRDRLAGLARRDQDRRERTRRPH